MNILFTCAGRRNYLIKYFKSALKNKGAVVAADNQLSAPALVDADVAIKVPKIYSAKYIPTLKKIIQEHNIKAVISLNDLELPILSQNKDTLQALGCRVLISNPTTIDIAFDKWKTYQFFKKIKIKTPKTYLTKDTALEAIKKNELNYPLIIKPRWGSASIAIDTVENEKELHLCFELQQLKLKKTILNTISNTDIDRSILIQEKIQGIEYGIDILNDFNGNHYKSFVRKKIAMRSGETDKAISVINKTFSKLGKTIGENTKHIGNMDCDFFVANNEVYFLEMNPRFGGGYPFSHEAGVDTPSIYIAWLENNYNIDKFDNFKADMMFSKCDYLMLIPSNNQ